VTSLGSACTVLVIGLANTRGRSRALGTILALFCDIVLGSSRKFDFPFLFVAFFRISPKALVHCL